MQRLYRKSASPISAEQVAKLEDLGVPSRKMPKTYLQARQKIAALGGANPNRRYTGDELYQLARQAQQSAPPREGERNSPERIAFLRALPYSEYRCTDWWKKLRRAALARAGFRCQVCNSDGKCQVHHRTYERIGCERDSDLTVLCCECHELYHFPERKRHQHKEPTD